MEFIFHIYTKIVKFSSEVDKIRAELYEIAKSGDGEGVKNLFAKAEVPIQKKVLLQEKILVPVDEYPNVGASGKQHVSSSESSCFRLCDDIPNLRKHQTVRLAKRNTASTGSPRLATSHYNFVGRIIGPRGMTVKELEKETGCRIVVRGLGCAREDRENTQESLHVLVQCEDFEELAQKKLAFAVELIRCLLVPPASFFFLFLD
ncbi:unnamed protein product [Gongylonema pulchrum]|uniref:KH domain-containing protein n=1 Tax=Gongylonema pulchrum TaxID=637853 RepID=A0A183CVT8_9BILA|nr:unnamed protein product [Gongylonema pulchrum]